MSLLVSYRIQSLIRCHFRCHYRSQDRGLNKFNAGSTLECPACKEMVHVGTGGHRNLESHRGSKACRATQKKVASRHTGRQSKPNNVLEMFFSSKVPLNPSTVSAPPLIEAQEIVKHPQLTTEACTLASTDTSESMAWLDPSLRPEPSSQASSARSSESSTLAPSKKQLEKQSPSQATKKATKKATVNVCQAAIGLVHWLEAAVDRIPCSVPHAAPDHRLTTFAIDPHACVDNLEPDEDDWAIINPIFKTSFGWGELETRAAVPHMLNRGVHGLDGFLRFLKFFVVQRGLEAVLFETKVELLISELERQYVYIT
jgi:hypothetical protein